jgi:hypothetical protein
VQLARSGRPPDHYRRAAERVADSAHDREARCAALIGGVANGQTERREVGAHAPEAGAFPGPVAGAPGSAPAGVPADAFFAQSAQSITPRMLHMLQMKRPQAAHGYP